MLDLQRLQIFRTVATMRSFSAAALELSYTQSSVSEAVATLERELGVTLLDRSSRPVRLTPSGEVVLGHAETLLAQTAAIETDLAALTSGDVGRLRLAGFYTAWSTFLPTAVANFAAAHPRVDLELEQLDPPAALRQLRAGELDLAVIFRFAPGDPADDPEARLSSTYLAHDPYALAVPAKSTMARKGRLRVGDLAKANWCCAPLGTPATTILQQFCREHGGFEARLEYPTDDVAMAQPLIAAGLAVALLPSLNLALPHPGVTVRDLPHAPPGRDIWCVRPVHQKLPAATAMISSLTRATSRLPQQRAARIRSTSNL
ncbi:MAG TPA: LysR family transcriptional regulator [Solirubrobacteraceae bacterium]|nr:LysR family transcriptional regulator [Solirubrobacteraceae bacterium]